MAVPSEVLCDMRTGEFCPGNEGRGRQMSSPLEILVSDPGVHAIHESVMLHRYFVNGYAAHAHYEWSTEADRTALPEVSHQEGTHSRREWLCERARRSRHVALDGDMAHVCVMGGTVEALEQMVDN